MTVLLRNGTWFLLKKPREINKLITSFLKSTGLQVAHLSSNKNIIEREFGEQFSTDTHWIYTESLDQPNRWTYDGTTLTERSDWADVSAQLDADNAASELAKVAADAREKRDGLLAATDFYALSDVTMSSAMTTYRTALRDVPAQENFPTVTWPTAP